jgi:hypothetical protein
MLWFDNSQTALTVKIQKAVDYYNKKYGRSPDLCLVHPSMLDAEGRNQRQLEINKLTVRPYRPVLPGHIWIVIEDNNLSSPCPLKNLPQTWPAGGIF